MLIAVVLLLAASCGEARSAKTLSPREVQQAFLKHGVTLIDTHLFAAADKAELRAAYFAADPNPEAGGNPPLAVGVYATDADAGRYAIAEASPLSDGGQVERAKNVVVYLKKDADQKTRRAVLEALDQLR